VLLGALAGGALAVLPGRAGLFAALLGALAGSAVGWRFGEHQPRFSPWSLALAAFFVPAFTLAVAPGAGLARPLALARGLPEGRLSPAWPGVATGAYPRGFSALIAMLWPLGPARAGLIAAGASYLIFWAGLAAVLEGPLRVPSARTIAAVALL